jgi:hypothetical protein
MTFGYYTHFSPVGGPASLQKWPTGAMADIFVTSSFTYGRYAKFGGSAEQSELTREKAAYFADLFKLPYLEVTGRPRRPQSERFSIPPTVRLGPPRSIPICSLDQPDKKKPGLRGCRPGFSELVTLCSQQGTGVG